MEILLKDYLKYEHPILVYRVTLWLFYLPRDFSIQNNFYDYFVHNYKKFRNMLILEHKIEFFVITSSPLRKFVIIKCFAKDLIH